MKHILSTLSVTILLGGWTPTLSGSTVLPEQAEEAVSLELGDKAPAIELSHVLKGKEHDQFKEGHVYVIEFWATWCPPCRTSIPHLTKMQEKFSAEVTVIGISDEPLKTVTGFLGKSDKKGISWNDSIQYTLATDPDRSAYNDYMKAAGKKGIPTAFIVGKDGTIEWITHPVKLDEPLTMIVNGTWDRDAYAAKEQRRQDMLSTAGYLSAESQNAPTKAEKELAIKKIDEALVNYPGFLAIQEMKFKLLLEDPSISNPYNWGRAVAEEHWDSASALSSLGWTAINSQGVTEEGRTFAMRTAIRADELTGHADPMVINTLARCYFVNGDLSKAIQLQEQAVDLSDPDWRDRFRKTLVEYEDQLDKT